MGSEMCIRDSREVESVGYSAAQNPLTEEKRKRQARKRGCAELRARSEGTAADPMFADLYETPQAYMAKKGDKSTGKGKQPIQEIPNLLGALQLHKHMSAELSRDLPDMMKRTRLPERRTVCPKAGIDVHPAAKRMTIMTLKGLIPMVQSAKRLLTEESHMNISSTSQIVENTRIASSTIEWLPSNLFECMRHQF